jgi:hypothetical protein
VKRWILTVREEARVQYEILAADEEDARILYERGYTGKMLLDEHDSPEILEVEESGAW